MRRLLLGASIGVLAATAALTAADPSALIEAVRTRNGAGIRTLIEQHADVNARQGDGATALKNIRAIGNDMKLDPGIGNCGKAGQWVPVGVGQPTLLIGGLTVGGSAA